MYINDADLSRCFENINMLLDNHCIIYLTETVAVKERLTLNQFYSEALSAKYSVIYRTPAEYNEYYKLLTANGFEITAQGYQPKLNCEQKYNETERWYTILQR